MMLAAWFYVSAVTSVSVVGHAPSPHSIPASFCDENAKDGAFIGIGENALE
jgi:hypothetical protein